MIRAEFSVSRQGISGFVFNGHAGLAPCGDDVLCAAVSAMALLTLNTLKEVFGARLNMVQREEDGYLFVSVTDIPKGREDAVYGVLRGLYLQLTDLRDQYPDNLLITTNEVEGDI